MPILLIRGLLGGALIEQLTFSRPYFEMRDFHAQEDSALNRIFCWIRKFPTQPILTLKRYVEVGFPSWRPTTRIMLVRTDRP